MDKEEAIKILKDFHDKSALFSVRTALETLHPELAESEDERIRKSLIILLQHFCKGYRVPGLDFPVSYKDMLAWLEKQYADPIKEYWRGYNEGKQNVLDKYAELEKQGKQENAERPKFKVGDWVVSPNGVYWHIDAIQNGRYEVTADTGQCGNWPLDTNIYRLWTIQDAKDGDVLYCDNGNNKTIYLFKEQRGLSNIANTHFQVLNMNNELRLMFNKAADFNLNTKPATKEQRDLLFQKMKEAGYEWDTEKKELKKFDFSKPIKYNSNPPSIVKEPAWTEDDENILNDMKDTIKECWNGDTRDILLDWFETIKQRIKGE